MNLQKQQQLRKLELKKLNLQDQVTMVSQKMEKLTFAKTQYEEQIATICNQIRDLNGDNEPQSQGDSK